MASRCAPPATPGATPIPGSTALRRDCDLRDLEVGEIPVPEESVLMVALTLALIFPCVNYMEYDDENWGKVLDPIYLSKKKNVNHSSKGHPLFAPELLY